MTDVISLVASALEPHVSNLVSLGGQAHAVQSVVDSHSVLTTETPNWENSPANTVGSSVSAQTAPKKIEAGQTIAPRQVQLAGVTATMDAELSGLAIGMTITSLLGTFIIGFSMIPQTVMTLRFKQTAKLSLAFYSISGLACFLLFVYGIGLADVPWQGGNPQQLQVLQDVGAIHGNVNMYLTMAGVSALNFAPSASAAGYGATPVTVYGANGAVSVHWISLNNLQSAWASGLLVKGVSSGKWVYWAPTASAATMPTGLATGHVYYEISTGSLVGIIGAVYPSSVVENLPINTSFTAGNTPSTIAIAGSAWGVASSNISDFNPTAATSSDTWADTNYYAPVTLSNIANSKDGALQQFKSTDNGTAWTLYNYYAILVKKAGYNVAMGFTLPGAAVIFGEFLVSSASILIAYQKFANMLGAKKEHITELEYEQKHYSYLLKKNSSMRN